MKSASRTFSTLVKKNWKRAIKTNNLVLGTLHRAPIYICVI